MRKNKLYRYIGRNGIITSLILLDNINHIPMYRLEADPGHVLTNGQLTLKKADIFVEDLDEWTEIPEEK